jgi:hypothetical protein
MQSKARLISSSLPLLALIGLTVASMVRFDRPLIRGDGVAYLAWVDTFVRDQDIDLANQYERFQPVNTYQITWDYEQEQFVNIFPFGVAFLQAPFYAVGGILTRQGWANQNPEYFVQMQGVEQGYSLAIMIGANMMALGSVGLAWRIARCFVDQWTAVLIAWGIFFGTPLFYYSTVSPLNSHNPGAFLTACLVYLLIICTGAFQYHSLTEGKAKLPQGYLPVLLGFVAGLMILVRWQLLLVVVCAWCLLGWERRWKTLALATLVMAVVMLPLPLVWNHLFGKPFVVPYDESTNEAFLRLPVHAHRVLFRMLHYSPILGLSMLGIPFLWYVDRRWTVYIGLVIGAQLLINGSTRDWYAGDSFGARRMSELYVAYVLLAAVVIGKVPYKAWLFPFRSAWPLLARGALIGLIVYSVVFFLAFLVFSWTNPAGVFVGSPDYMLGYFFDHPYRTEVMKATFQTHIGPSAWSMPGP